jgi:hypothetical protein
MPRRRSNRPMSATHVCLLRRVGLVAAALAASLASAGEKGATVHAMEWLEGETIHLADEQGAINRHGESKISIDLTDSKNVTVTERGSRSEHNLYANFSTEESMTWSNAWKGTWSTRGAELRLELSLTARTCKRSKTGGGEASARCAELSPKVTVTCTPMTVTLEAPTRGPKQQRAALRCSAGEGTTLGDTPAAWILGRSSCLSSSDGGGGGTIFRPCPP